MVSSVNTTQFWPSLLLLELTSRCNLRCLMCAINADVRIQKGGEWYGDLDFKAFENLERVISNIYRIELNGHGESLLSPHFLPILEKVKKNGCLVGLTTNALPMGERLTEGIVSNGMNEMNISIHAAEPKLYAEISRNGDFSKLIQNIERLNFYKEKYKTDLPLITFQFVGMKKNIDQLEDLVRLAHKLKAKEVCVLALTEFDNVKGESLDKHPDLINNYIPKAIATAENLNIQLTIPPLYLEKVNTENDTQEEVGQAITEPSFNSGIKEKAKSMLGFPSPKQESPEGTLARDCMDPWDFCIVMQSGRIRPCCIIEDNMGDLAEQPFENIWWGEKYQQLRSSILNNTPPKECITCIYRPMTTLGNLQQKVSQKIQWNKGYYTT